jgi:hypothetical protein
MIEKMEKEEFVRRVESRYLNAVARVWFIAAYFSAIALSFFVVFMRESDIATRIRGKEQFLLYQEAISAVVAAALIVSFLGTALFTYFFVGTRLNLSNFSIARFRAHSFFPLSFLLYVYLATGVFAILIYAFEVEFLVRGEAMSLSLLDSFYFTASVISTIGQNDISPASIISKILTIGLYGATLLLVIFVFQNVSKNVRFVVSSERIRDDAELAYKMARESFVLHDLNGMCRRKVLEYFANRHDFEGPDGLHRVKMSMDAGNFRFASCKP